MVLSFLPFLRRSFFPSVLLVPRDTVRSEDTSRGWIPGCGGGEGGVVSGIQRGGWFFLSSPRRKMGGPEGVQECLICGCSGLLYEILIPEDIQQAYI